MRLNQLVFQLCSFRVALALLLPWSALACRCIPPTLLSAFQNADVVLQATLLKKLNTSTEFELFYSAKIGRVWKGCGNFIGIETTTITTRTQSAGCGVRFLKFGTVYLFSGYLNRATNKTVLSINTCGYQTEWRSLNATQKTQVEKLSKKYSNCTCTSKSCGPQLGMPNSICPDGVSVAGPGNCSYSQKYGICAWEIMQCPTCKKESDCRKGQFCSAGTCRADGTCSGDVDCSNPANPFVFKCPGRPVCTNSNCTLDCTHPCPGGGHVVNCFVDPCKFTTCKAPHVACVSDYCGSCNAFFYNASGYRVCSKTP